jgi:DNA end-binding protein Ku
MADSGRAALATFVMRGKENLVAIRVADDHLVLHTLFFADEVREAPRVAGDRSQVRGSEVQLARRLIDELASESFKPEHYEDTYRSRILDAAKAKAKGKTLKIEEPSEPHGRVVDIMDALKASLEKRRRPGTAASAEVRSARSARRKAS